MNRCPEFDGAACRRLYATRESETKGDGGGAALSAREETRAGEGERGTRGGKVRGREKGKREGERDERRRARKRGRRARERRTNTRIQIRRVGGRCGKSAALRGRSSRHCVIVNRIRH